MSNKVNGLRHIHQFPTFPINIEARTNQKERNSDLFHNWIIFSENESTVGVVVHVVDVADFVAGTVAVDVADAACFALNADLFQLLLYSL